MSFMFFLVFVPDAYRRRLSRIDPKDIEQLQAHLEQRKDDGGEKGEADGDADGGEGKDKREKKKFDPKGYPASREMHKEVGQAQRQSAAM